MTILTERVLKNIQDVFQKEHRELLLLRQTRKAVAKYIVYAKYLSDILFAARVIANTNAK